MAETPPIPENHDTPGLYEIRLKGQLKDRWVCSFEGLTMTLAEDGNTVLTGPVIDQAALHGLLKRVRDSGMTLVSVNFINPDQAGPKEDRL